MKYRTLHHAPAAHLDDTAADPARRGLLRAALALGAAACGLSALPARADALVVGMLAPPVTLHTLDGREIDTRTLLGQVVIVTFWSTRCDPCRRELPILATYAAEHAHEGLQVLGFCMDGADDVAQVRAVAAKLSFPVGLAASPWFGSYGRIWRVPVSFVIDRQGRLAHDGWHDRDGAWTAERLHALVDPLLAADSGAQQPS